MVSDAPFDLAESAASDLSPASEPAEPSGPGTSGGQSWQTIGLHRPIASFWFNFVLLLVAIAPAVAVVGYLLPNVILPYPSAMGFHGLTTTYFALFFSIMDLATGPAAERFIAQHAEFNPRKALRYVQFFIWFQMTTGVVQITAIAFFCLKYLVHTSLAYATWFFLLFSTTQFPGMLGTYSFTLRGFQRYDRDAIVAIVQGVGFETFTQVAFILLGRWAGSHNPEIGELVGATMGYVLGRYIDDFAAMALAAFFVSKVLKPYGISLRETITPDFGREEVWECLSFGLRLLGAPVVSYAADYVVLLMMVEWLPNYVAVMGLVSVAKLIADFVGTRYSFAALLSEANNNGKKALTSYVVTSMWKHWWYLAFFLALEISMVFPVVVSLLGGNYAAAAPIIPLYVFPRLLVQPAVMGADVLQSCDRPTYRTIGILVEKSTKMAAFFLLISPWGLTRVIGRGYMVELYVLHDLPAYVAITLAEFWFVHKKVVPVRISWWQTFGAGTLASIPLVPVNLLMVRAIEGVAARGNDAAALGTAALFFLLVLLLLPAVVFFFYGLFGGWDDRGLEHFSNAVELCGPSKPFVRFFYGATRAGHRLSPWANRFPIPHEAADREVEELMAQHALSARKGDVSIGGQL
ncbi:MAG: hypothetical protein Kow0069_31810 [Promethearchaeota archaeon]